jgi:hypothetical protein
MLCLLGVIFGISITVSANIHILNEAQELRPNLTVIQLIRRLSF